MSFCDAAFLSSPTKSTALLRYLRCCAISLVVIFCLSASPVFAGADAEPEGGRSEWKIGYWLWHAYADRQQKPEKSPAIDLLYILVGNLHASRQDQYSASEITWPQRLPQAAAYFAVWRLEGPLPPNVALVPELSKQYRSLKNRAIANGQNLVGVQLDYDCPTARLNDYARFLGSLRQALPKEDQLSITALPDWFRAGTGVAEVVREVDEYVPQFYDVGPKSGNDTGGLAAVIDTSRWAGIFNSLGRPFRIGIASFGRIAVECRDGASHSQPIKRQFSRDMSPLELFKNRDLTLVETVNSPAGEILLRFRAHTERYGWYRSWYGSFCTGAQTGVEMTIPTPESVAKAYAAAQAMGRWCTGVIFFRWPLENEALALSSAEIRKAIAGEKTVIGKAMVEVEDGFCAATHCVDLYIRLPERFPKKPGTLSVGCSVELEYFLPGDQVETRLKGLRNIEAIIPAYAGLPRIYLGRAVSRDAASFVVEGEGR